MTDTATHHRCCCCCCCSGCWWDWQCLAWWTSDDDWKRCRYSVWHYGFQCRSFTAYAVSFL